MARAKRRGGRFLWTHLGQPAWRDPETGFLRRSLSPPGGAPMELVWSELPSGAEVAYPAATYAFIADQQVVVLEGALTIVQGGVADDLGPGDCLRFGPPQDAVFRNAGAFPCRYLVAALRVADGPGTLLPNTTTRRDYNE